MTSSNEATPIYENPRALAEAFQTLEPLKVPLPEGERALWSVPRRTGEWRLPHNDWDTNDDEPMLLPMVTPRYPSGAEGADIRGGVYMNVLPNPLVMHTDVGRALEDSAAELFDAHPKEATLAETRFGVPMLFGRFDAVLDEAGNVGVCELDDVCSLWGWNQEINPLADIGFMELEDRLLEAGYPLYLAELYENVRFFYANDTPADGPGMFSAFERRVYAHCDSLPRMALPGMPLLPDEVPYDPNVAILFRARLQADLFAYYARKLAHQGVTPMETRDDKTYLAKVGLGRLACDLQVALDAGEMIIRSGQHEYVVLKARGARTESTAILSLRGTKERGTYSRSQILRKLGNAAGGPVVIQPFYRPPTMQQLGLTFAEGDAATIQAEIHRGADAGKYTVPGQEGRFNVVLRSFVVFNPQEKRIEHVGGQWAASPGLIVHGAANSVAGPLYDESYRPTNSPSCNRAATSAVDMLDAHAYLRMQ